MVGLRDDDGCGWGWGEGGVMSMVVDDVVAVVEVVLFVEERDWSGCN